MRHAIDNVTTTVEIKVVAAGYPKAALIERNETGTAGRWVVEGDGCYYLLGV
jgi:hypothetical protein